MTSITIPGVGVGLPSGKRLTLDRNRWLRYGLGVAIAGLLAADATVLVNAFRSDDPAGVSRQAPAVVAEVPGSGASGAAGGNGTTATSVVSQTSTSADGGPAPISVAVPGEPTSAFGSAGSAPGSGVVGGRTTTPAVNNNGAPPGTGGGGSGVLDPVTDAVNGLPVVGEVVGPVVEDVADQVPPVEDELPVDGTDVPELPVDVPVSVPVSVPTGLLP